LPASGIPAPIAASVLLSRCRPEGLATNNAPLGLECRRH
jgi:hypothetical protein